MIFISDTSTARCFCMLAEEGEVRASLELNTGLQHGSTYQVCVAQLLDLVGLKPSEVEAWGVVTGPGSFTGLRMAVAATKVYAYLYDTPVLGINGLEARAWTLLKRPASVGTIKPRLAVPLLDARGGRCWSGLYVWEEGRTKALREVTSGPIEDLAQELASYQDRYDLVIGGLTLPTKTDEALNQYLKAYALDQGLGLVAEDVAALAACQLEAGEVVTAQDLAVEYFSLSQAERMLAEKGEAVVLPEPEMTRHV